MTTTTANKITEVPEGMKVILRGYCVRTNHSLSLDTETLYYLEKHGLGHYFVSKFPSGARSHMGVYEATRFKIEREELVPIESKSKPLTVAPTMKKEDTEVVTADFMEEINEEHVNVATDPQEGIVEQSVITQAAAQTNAAALPAEQAQQEEITTPSELMMQQDAEDELKEMMPLSAIPFADHYLTPGEQAVIEEKLFKPTTTIEGTVQSVVLEQGKVYSARAIYKEPVSLTMKLNETYYIIAKDKSNPYCTPTSCCVYTDAACTNLIMLTSTSWFADITEISALPAVKDEASCLEQPVPVQEVETSPVTEETKTVVTNPIVATTPIGPIVAETEEIVPGISTEEPLEPVKQDEVKRPSNARRKKLVSEDQLVFDMFDL